MSLPYRIDALLGTLLACIVGCTAAARSPSLAFDAGVLLVGTAMAYPVLWRSPWSWLSLMRVAIAAYFFRCVVLYIMGSDSLKLIAVQDIGMGLLAYGVAYAGRNALGKYMRQEERTASRQAVRDGDAPGNGSDLGEEAVEERAGEPASRRPGEEADWSPPQFTMKTMLVIALGSIGLVKVGVTAGREAAFGVLVLGLFGLLIAGFVRLVLSGKNNG